MSDPSESVRPNSASSGTCPSRLLFTLHIWFARYQQRKALGDLAECNNNLLKDIGLSDEQARREAVKWFWQT
jgi:uncharacterized protein YjiS (DUF1127 family)